MSTPGWYPDPAGTPGNFRFWDGQRWSSETSTNPSATPPKAPDQKPTRGAFRNGWLIALVALVAVTAVIVFWALRGGAGPSNDPVTPDTNSAAPSVDPWDETSSPTPSTPPPTTTAQGQLVTCPTTSQSGDTRQTKDRLVADTLSVQRISGWTSQNMSLQFAYDMHTQIDYVYTNWMSNIGVALMSNADGFVDIKTSAEQAMDCFASSGYYLYFTDRVDLISEQITVSGHAAWHLRAEVHVDHPNLPNVLGDVTDIVVVDLGAGKDHLGLFFSSCTIGDDPRCSLVQQALASLSVDG